MSGAHAIREADQFGRFGCSLQALAAVCVQIGFEQFARVSMDKARELMAAGETDAAAYYLNRAAWALRADA